MGQPRIFYAMAADGLFPKWVAKVHPKYHTPYVATIITGVVCALAGGLLPINVLGEMTSIGTLFAFVLVNIGVIILRVKQPNAARLFKVPGGKVGGFLIPGNWCYSVGGANRNGQCSDHNSTIRLDGNWNCVLFCLWISAFPIGLGGERQGIETARQFQWEILSRLRIL